MQDRYQNLYCCNCKNHFEWILSQKTLKTIENIYFKDNSYGTLSEKDGKHILSIVCFECGTTTDFVGKPK